MTRRGVLAKYREEFEVEVRVSLHLFIVTFIRHIVEFSIRNYVLNQMKLSSKVINDIAAFGVIGLNQNLWPSYSIITKASTMLMISQ